MSIKRVLISGLVCLSALAPLAVAQRGDMDPDIKNFKLSMEKVRAYDGAIHKLFAASAADPSMQDSFKDATSKKTLNDMVATVEHTPKLMGVVKSSGLSTREFCIIPMSLMAAGGAYMIQTEYKKDASSLALPENIAFYGKNKVELEKITNSWNQPRQKE